MKAPAHSPYSSPVQTTRREFLKQSCRTGLALALSGWITACSKPQDVTPVTPTTPSKTSLQLAQQEIAAQSYPIPANKVGTWEEVVWKNDNRLNYEGFAASNDYFFATFKDLLAKNKVNPVVLWINDSGHPDIYKLFQGKYESILKAGVVRFRLISYDNIVDESTANEPLKNVYVRDGFTPWYSGTISHGIAILETALNAQVLDFLYGLSQQYPSYESSPFKIVFDGRMDSNLPAGPGTAVTHKATADKNPNTTFIYSGSQGVVIPPTREANPQIAYYNTANVIPFRSYPNYYLTEASEQPDAALWFDKVSHLNIIGGFRLDPNSDPIANLKANFTTDGVFDQGITAIAQGVVANLPTYGSQGGNSIATPIQALNAAMAAAISVKPLTGPFYKKNFLPLSNIKMPTSGKPVLNPGLTLMQATNAVPVQVEIGPEDNFLISDKTTVVDFSGNLDIQNMDGKAFLKADDVAKASSTAPLYVAFRVVAPNGKIHYAPVKIVVKTIGSNTTTYLHGLENTTLKGG